MEKFGVMATIRALAMGDILKADEILHQPYSLVFTWLHMSSEESKYKKKYLEIIRKKK